VWRSVGLGGQVALEGDGGTHDAGPFLSRPAVHGAHKLGAAGCAKRRLALCASPTVLRRLLAGTINGPLERPQRIPRGTARDRPGEKKSGGNERAWASAERACSLAGWHVVRGVACRARLGGMARIMSRASAASQTSATGGTARMLGPRAPGRRANTQPPNYKVDGPLQLDCLRRNRLTKRLPWL